MSRKSLGLILGSALVLSACKSPLYNQTEANVADVKIKAQEAHQRFDNSLKAKPALVVKNGAYVDLTPIDLEKNPGWLQNRIVIRGDQLPFSYYSRVIASGAGTHVLSKYQNELDQAVNVSMNYSGTVKGALDLLASKTGYVYNVKNKQIYWQALVSKTFDIAFFPGSTDYSMGKGSAAATSTSSAASSSGTGKPVAMDLSEGEYSSLSGKLSVWKDLETAIKSMLSKDGKVVVSESTASVTVRDKATNLQVIEQYIKTLNKNLSHQVLVKVQILEVALSAEYNFGIDWNIINKAFQNTQYKLVDATFGRSLDSSVLTLAGSDKYPTLGLQSSKTDGNYALIKALNQQGKTSVVSEPRVMATNNQVTAIRVVTQEAYVASVENTTQASGTGGGNNVSSTVTPSTITYGVTIYLLPKILNDKVYLQVNADLSTRDALTKYTTNPAAANSTTGQANSVTIQLPTVSQKHFNQRSMIRSGDTLVLAGFRKLNNTANAQQLLRSQALGGKGAIAENSETIILITPVIMDENA